MLYVFAKVLPTDKPTYYGASGTIALKGLNPALGFRPQIDVENNLISYRLEKSKDGQIKRNSDSQVYVRNLMHFLHASNFFDYFCFSRRRFIRECLCVFKEYIDQENANVVACSPGVNNTQAISQGKACSFDYEDIFKDTPCTEEKKFGYDTEKPCVLLKLNKVIDFIPKTSLNITCYADVMRLNSYLILAL